MKVRMLFSLLAICLIATTALPQETSTDLAVLKFSWDKERIRPRASVSSMASQEELVEQSRRERQLAAARNNADRATAARVETQITNHENAKAKAVQTDSPNDGYRYKVTVRNDGTKTIKSVDWDYIFIDPSNNTEVSHHQFTSDETIKPTKRKEISVLYLVPPVRVINARLLNDKGALPYTEQVVISRIQYSDGSVWQRP